MPGWAQAPGDACGAMLYLSRDDRNAQEQSQHERRDDGADMHPSGARLEDLGPRPEFRAGVALRPFDGGWSIAVALEILSAGDPDLPGQRQSSDGHQQGAAQQQDQFEALHDEREPEGPPHQPGLRCETTTPARARKTTVRRASTPDSRSTICG